MTASSPAEGKKKTTTKKSVLPGLRAAPPPPPAWPLAWAILEAELREVGHPRTPQQARSGEWGMAAGAPAHLQRLGQG